MDILGGVIFLIALAGFLTLTLAAFNDAWGRRIAAILLARAEAREAYRERYTEVLGQRESEFGLKELPE